MKGKREPRIDAKLKRAPKDLQRELWELRNPPDPEQKPLSFDELQVEVPRIFGFTASAGALSDWLAWYGLNLRMEEAEQRSLQAKLQLAKDPKLSPETLAKVAQFIFTAEAMERKDTKAFVALEMTRQQETKLKQNERKLAQADKALDHDARRIAILEKKAARFDEMEAKAKELKKGGGLSPETLELLEKQLKLL
jgi:hypothetical protein